MANDEKILDELHFLSWKIEALEKKLETSLAIQEDLAASLLHEDSSTTSVASAKKSNRNNISGSSCCSEPISSGDEQSTPRFDDGTDFENLEQDQEQERTYLIIPVGSYKEKGSLMFPAEKQTFTWSEMDDNACKCTSSIEVLSSEKEMANNLDANQLNTSKPNNSNHLKSFANQETPLGQKRFVVNEEQMCTQWNGNNSEIIPLDDCLLHSTDPHSIEKDPFERQGKIGGAFDIEYDEDNEKVSSETKRASTLLSNCKYGLTIGIATGKSSSQDIGFSDINSSREVDKRSDQHLEHYEKITTHFVAQGIKEQRPAATQLSPLLKESTSQSTYSSDDVTFDQTCNHPLKSMFCDNRLMEYKQNSTDTNTYSADKANQLPTKVIYVDSDSSEDVETNFDFVVASVQDTFSCERTPHSLSVNVDEQSSWAYTASDSKHVSLDYLRVLKNGKNEADVYSTQTVELFQKGNHCFTQNEIERDAVSKQLIEMQIHGVPEEQRYEDGYFTESFVAHNGIGGSYHTETGTRNITGKVNNNGETVKYQVNRTKHPSQEVVGQISHFNDHIYGIVGYQNNYKAINTDSIDTAGVGKIQPKSPLPYPGREKKVKNPDIPARGPHTNSTGDDMFPKRFIRSQKYLDERALHDETQSRVCLDGDLLRESRVLETAMSSASDDVFFDPPPNMDSELPDSANSVNNPSMFDVFESESPYSSLTSVSSNNEAIHPWRLRKDSLSRLRGSEDRKQFISYNAGGASREKNQQRTSAPSYIRENESSSDSEFPMRSIRLSPLPSRGAHSPSLQKHLSGVSPRDSRPEPMGVSSPTPSVDTSDFSTSDSVCGCLYLCECQTGISSAEDFREELKAISTYVLKAHNESAPFHKSPRTRYFLDEEQGELEIFDGRLQKKENRAVPILVRVILRLRKHFFGTLESKTPYNGKTQCDVNNSDRDSLDQSDGQASTDDQRSRKISFSPSAMLLSAIGENSAAELKEVIEKENIDVNQLSPSGRSLLHKAAAAGDLESIYTLVQYGAFVNILDQEGFPPIHSALRKANFKCAVLLIECGTDMARYTNERVRQFLEIKNMTAGHFPVLLKTNL